MNSWAHYTGPLFMLPFEPDGFQHAIQSPLNTCLSSIRSWSCTKLQLIQM